MAQVSLPNNYTLLLLGTLRFTKANSIWYIPGVVKKEFKKYFDNTNGKINFQLHLLNVTDITL